MHIQSVPLSLHDGHINAITADRARIIGHPVFKCRDGKNDIYNLSHYYATFHLNISCYVLLYVCITCTYDIQGVRLPPLSALVIIVFSVVFNRDKRESHEHRKCCKNVHFNSELIKHY